MGLGREVSNANAFTNANANAYTDTDTYNPTQIRCTSHHDSCQDTNLYRRQHATTTTSSQSVREDTFQEVLKKSGLEEVEQEGDGNCLFRAVSLQVYGDSDSHVDVRRRCMDFMVSFAESLWMASGILGMHVFSSWHLFSIHS